MPTSRAGIAAALLLAACPAVAQVATIDVGASVERVGEIKLLLAKLRADMKQKESEIKAGKVSHEDAQNEVDRRAREIMETFRPRLVAIARELADEGGWDLIVDASVGADFLEKVPADDLTNEFVARYDARRPVPGQSTRAPGKPRASRTAGAAPRFMVVDLDRAPQWTADWKRSLAHVQQQRAEAQAWLDAKTAILKELRAALEMGTTPLPDLRKRLEDEIWKVRSTDDEPRPSVGPMLERAAVERLLEMLTQKIRSRAKSRESGVNTTHEVLLESRRDSVQMFAEQEAARRGAVLLPSSKVVFRRSGEDLTAELVRLYDALPVKPESDEWW